MSETPANLEAATSRRNLLLGGLATGGAAALVAASTAGEASAQTPPSQSVLDKALSTKKLAVAASLKYPPNMFVNSAGDPDGYEIEVIKRMLKDITPDLEIEFVDMDFGQMFAAVETGRADLMTSGTILPSRSLRGWFSGCAVAFQPVYVLTKAGNTIDANAINTADFRFATLQGSSQEASIKRLYPNAQVSAFPDQNGAIAEVMSGRANATLQSLFTIVNMKKQGVEVALASDEPAYVDHNAFFLPAGDIKLWMYVTNWLLYNAANGELNKIYRQYIGQDAIAAGLPYITVGPGGAPVRVTA